MYLRSQKGEISNFLGEKFTAQFFNFSGEEIYHREICWFPLFWRILILSWHSTFFFKKMGKSATENEFFNFSGEENFHRENCWFPLFWLSRLLISPFFHRPRGKFALQFFADHFFSVADFPIFVTISIEMLNFSVTIDGYCHFSCWFPHFALQFRLRDSGRYLNLLRLAWNSGLKGFSVLAFICLIEGEPKKWRLGGQSDNFCFGSLR